LPSPWWGDLAAVVVLALGGLVVALIPATGAVRTAALLPLVLILPGYALGAALFLPGEISRELRAVLSVAFSVAVAALGGLVVQLIFSLDRPVWAMLLAFATVLAALVALDRRDAMPAESVPPRLVLPRIGLVSVVGILVAVGVAGGAIAIATRGEHRQQSESRFSSLSLVPNGSSAIAPPVTVGVFNHEGRAVSYLVVVRRGPGTIRRWRFRLKANQDWQAQLGGSAISGRGPLIARLDRGGQPYHRVALRIGGGK
jgi:Protein of unknown function (DUF1616)